MCQRPEMPPPLPRPLPLQSPGYNCPRSCYKDPNCHCASHEIPGGLGAWEIPQFVVLVSEPLAASEAPAGAPPADSTSRACHRF
jgi:hypothetical protein